MRISLLANFPPHVIPQLREGAPTGHFATWLPQLAEQFAEAAEFEFHWLTVTRKKISEQPIRWKGQSFHFLYNPQRFRMLRAYARDCRILRQRLDALNPRLVHAWGTEDCYGLAGARCGHLWMLSMQGILQEYVRRAPMHPLVRLQALYEKFILGRAKEITVESVWGEGVLKRLAPQAHVQRVEYGAQPIFFEYAWEPVPSKPHALFVGTPEPRKGIREAVRAFGRPELAGTELHIVGDVDSAFVRELKAGATPNVRWLGRRGTAEIAEAMAHAWCLVLPTYADTSPNVVKEARVVGLPVVTTAAGGQSDYIKDGVNGFVVGVKAIDELAQRLALLLHDLPKCRAMGAALHVEQREHFKPHHTAEAFLKIYRDLCAASVA